MPEQMKPLTTGDFVEVSYTARTDDDGRVIDTTDPDVADDAAIADIVATGPTVIVLGAGHLFEPVETAIQDAGIGGSGEVVVAAEDAFGTVDPTARRTVDTDQLPAERPSPGERVRFEGETAFVESIDEAAATLNFNHPLAGTAIEYEFTVHGRVDDSTTQVESILAMYELVDVVEATVEGSSSGPVVQLTVADPTDEIDEWERRKQRVVDDVTSWVQGDQLRMVEDYAL